MFDSPYFQGGIGEPINDLPIKGGVLDYTTPRTSAGGRCRDCTFLVIFIVALFVGLLFFFYVVFNNKVTSLTQPTAHTEICGVSSVVEDKPYLYFSDFRAITEGWCVDACPTDRKHCVCLNENPTSNSSQECEALKKTKDCTDHNELTIQKKFKSVMHYCYPPTVPKWVELFDAKYKTSSYAVSLSSRGWVVILSYILAVALSVLLMMLTIYAVKGLSYFITVLSLTVIFVLSVGFIIIGIAFFSSGDLNRQLNGLPTVLIGIVLVILGLLAHISSFIFCL
jgi:hypothetical protein